MFDVLPKGSEAFQHYTIAAIPNPDLPLLGVLKSLVVFNQTDSLVFGVFSGFSRPRDNFTPLLKTCNPVGGTPSSTA